jgi:hypothetical protein
MTKNDEIIIRSACDRDAERMAFLCKQLGYEVIPILHEDALN